ncbi:class I SAM-dependent methyltransferase [Burkholderia cenocepacia]|nr:class I SAM-dependent methyltransferase [Burkholderia cenocepacia]
MHKLLESGVVAPGRRGIVFGVGQERLPALFASMGASIVATDAPPEIGVASGWRQSNQHSDSLSQLRYDDIAPSNVFYARVRHRYCDMTAIPDDLNGFDFTWSSCCYEHLGSLEAGAQFVIDSVEKVLKVGGVACHTTEFNLSSDDETIEEGPTVLYRRRDMVELIDRLRQRGHTVEPFVIAPDSHFLDHHVDVPPWTHNPHLKLRMGEYVATSAGILVTRGR